jgi:hypothetical protein
LIDVDVISKLPELIWRGLKAPCDVGAFDVEHTLPPRRYPYVNGEGHDNTGRASIPITATLFFLSTVQEDAFPTLWNSWLPVLLEGDEGELQHPVLGSIKARVQRWKANLTAQVRSGFAVDVTWLETISDPASETIFGLVDPGLASTAEAAEAAAASLGIVYPPGRPTTSLLGAIRALQNLRFLAELTANIVASQILGAVSLMTDLAEAHTDHTAWVAVDLLQNVWLQLHDIATSSAKLLPRPVAKRRLQRDTTLDGFASSVNNTLDDMAQLNPFALRFPIVSKGTTLAYFT